MNQIEIKCTCNKCDNKWSEVTDLNIDDLFFTDDELMFHLLGRFKDNEKLLSFLIKYDVIPNSSYCYDAINVYKLFMPISSVEKELKLELLSKVYNKYTLTEIENIFKDKL